MFEHSLARRAGKLGSGLALSAVLLGAPLVCRAQTGAPTSAEPEPAPAALREESPPHGPLRQKDKGVVLLCNFSARLFMIAADGNNTPSQTALQGGIFGGYKKGRLLFGLGFDISNFDTEVRFSDGVNSSKALVSNTGFLFSPGAQYSIVRSADGRVEMLGAAQLGLGSIVSRTARDPELPPELQIVDDSRTFYLQYKLAPGLRVWALPQLAFNLLTGVSGDHLFTFTNNPSGSRDDQRASTAFFLNLGAMGVF
jgi:hypothetical protein